jgi:hypothetical protein
VFLYLESIFKNLSPEPAGQFQRMNGIQVCSNKWPDPLQRGDNYTNAKIGGSC